MRARVGAVTVGLLALLGVPAPAVQADHKENHRPGAKGGGGGPGSSETLIPELESYRDVCTPVPTAICRADGHANASESGSNVALFSPSLYGLAGIPLPFDAAGEWSRVNRAAHGLAAPVSQVTYRWESNVIEARSDVEGPLSAWAVLGLRVQHTGCTACTATVRHVLVGDDPHDDQPAAASSNSFTQPVLEVVLRDPSGAPLPAGTVEVRTVLAGHVEATAAPTWQGLASTYVRLFEGTLTARSEP